MVDYSHGKMSRPPLVARTRPSLLRLLPAGANASNARLRVKAVRVALFGATGMIGSQILAEAIDRGHDVTAVVRGTTRPFVQGRTIRGDATNARSVARVAAGHEAVISAIGGVADGNPRAVVTAAHALISGLREADVRRLIVVGGAGSLTTADGIRVVDTPEFPASWRPGSLAQAEALEVFRARAGRLGWTYVSPAHLIEPGERTARYTTGRHHLVTDAAGVSRISTQDYAVALIDELERPAHLRTRFTVGYG